MNDAARPASLLDHPDVDRLLRLAIDEDVGSGDVTSQLMVPADCRGSARLMTREAIVVCGLELVERVRNLMQAEFAVEPRVRDGDSVEAGRVLITLDGGARDILTAERLILNLIQRLSGIATTTGRYRQAMAAPGCALLETRKTVPGWRILDKYAVRIGGGQNHRMGLFDQILAKENHFRLAGCDRNGAGFDAALSRVLDARPDGMLVEVEVETLAQFDRALASEVDIVLLDNMSLADMTEAVRRRNARGLTPLLEASGGITLDSIAAVAATGVDRISCGALTHSVRAPDITLLF